MVQVSDFLTDNMDIVAHIFFAVGTMDEAVVTTVAGEYVGTLCYPDGDGVLFSLGDDAIPSPRLVGTSVCVEYAGPGDHYRFYTDVVAVEAHAIRVNLPNAIERNDRRLAKRQVIPPNLGFGFRATELPGMPVFPVADLATGGVGLVDVYQPAPEIGDLLVGELILPGEAIMQVCLDVRHVELHKGRLLLGARISAITTMDRVRLARFLVRWARDCT